MGAAGPYVAGLAALGLLGLFVGLRFRQARLGAEFRARHASEGRNMLIVYSDSARWGPYIEASWLTRWGHRAVVLNRSRPWKEEQIEARLWREVAGQAEHTPVVIVVPPRGSPRVVRFWRAFREHEHGRDGLLRAAEAKVDDLTSR